jgi:hypothetical protein
MATDTTPYPALLERYAEMHVLSQEMLRAAQAQEWERLAEIGLLRDSIVEELRVRDVSRWTGADAEQKAELIRQIQKIDKEILPLAEAGRDDTRAQLGSINVGKKLKKAYDSP